MWIYSKQSMCMYVEGPYSRVRARIYDWTVCMCGANHPPAIRNGKVLCLYAYISGKGRGMGRVSLRTLSCTLTRRRFPIFRPKLSTEKPSDSSFLSLSLPFSLARIVIPFLAATTLVCNVKPSYSDKIERIPPKRLRHATSASPVPRSPSVDAFEIFIIYKPRESGSNLQIDIS